VFLWSVANEQQYDNNYKIIAVGFEVGDAMFLQHFGKDLTEYTRSHTRKE
jgi:hypothetical protein